MKKITKFLSVPIIVLLLSGCTKHKPDIPEPPKTATITVVNGTGGGVFEIGTTATITATIPDYKSFSYWESNNTNVSTDNPYTFTVNQDATFEAKFNNQSGTLTVINGQGSGTYDLNTSVTVTATPGNLQTFNHWEIDGNNVSTDNPYTFTFLQNTTITAVMDDLDPMAAYTRTLYKKDDDFKILNLTDVQFHDGDSLTLVKHIVDTLVEREHPDMITLLGDTINDNKTYDVKENARKFISYLDSFDIPWAPIFGNHDYIEYHPDYTKKTVGADYLITLFNECENCLFIDGPEDVQGHSNYLVNVVDEKTGDIFESLVFLDSKTAGLDETNVQFYEDAINYAKKLNGGNNVRSIMFDHIPIQEYLDAFEYSQSIECRDIYGIPVMTPLSAGTREMFAKIKELGSTKTVICGHDHEDAYYSEYDGITLVHALKSSEGDDIDGISYRHPLGGLMVTLDGSEDNLRYSRVEDISYTITSDFPYHPPVLPYWKYSGAKLVFDMEMPDSGTVKFNLQGSNLMRSSLEMSKRTGAWNRLTTNVTLNGSTKSADLGTLTQIEGNKYHYELDLADMVLNTSGGEVAYGDETVRIIYFHSANAEFTITNVHYEMEEVTETNQVDLANASIEVIADQPFNDVPSKPQPKVTLDGKTLVKGTDIIYTYSNNTAVGEATLTIVPSGKGAHNYKGQKSITFNVIANPDADKVPGHENAITVNSNDSYVSNGTKNDWVIAEDWYNCNKLLHIELKRLENGLVKSGETVRFTLMGANKNPGSGQCDPSGNWNRLTGYYKLDFSNNGVVCYENNNKSNVIATGVELGDGWFSLEIDFKKLNLNSSENVHGNEYETMQRVEFSQLARSFKYDKVSLVDKK